MRPYQGPIGLSVSRYANPQLVGGQPSIVPARSSLISPVANNVIATREQILASSNESPTGAQGDTLPQEVDAHIAKFSQKFESTKAKSHGLLALIREALQKDNVAGVDSATKLWAELEQLFEATTDIKDAFPKYLEKLRNNMAIRYSHSINKVYRDAQTELDLQHNKVELQYGLILEQQQAFMDLKAEAAAKLASTAAERQEFLAKISRLTLEKGNYRTELPDATSEHLAEIESLRKTVSDLQETMQAKEKELTDRFVAELKAKDDLANEEAELYACLRDEIDKIQDKVSVIVSENEKVRADNENINLKYSHLATEHAHLFSNDKDRTKKVETLTDDAQRLREENKELVQKLTELPELEEKCLELSNKDFDQTAQLGKFAAELDAANILKDRAEQALDTLKKTVEKIQKEKADLEAKNKAMLAKQDELAAGNKTDSHAHHQEVFELRNENMSLQMLLNEKKYQQGTSSIAGTANDEQVKALEGKVRELEENKVALEKSLHEWCGLAKASYAEYKAMLPTYKQAEQHREDALAKEQQIKDLELQLAAKEDQANDAMAEEEAYWKGRYDNLMATFEI